MAKFTAKSSLIALILLGILLSVYRISNVSDKETSWDVLGYYLYLPATFVHHDPLLNDISWLKAVNEEKQLTGTLYQLSANNKGEPMYFFLYGMSLFLLPFFLLGHLFAGISGQPMDGFSYPYQFSLVVGGILYTLIGLIFLRKILRRFFPEITTALVMVLIVLGTNYINHLTIKNLEPVNVLFMLMTLVVWHSIRWVETKKPCYLMLIGVFSMLMMLVKPSEIIVLLIPLFWGLSTTKEVKQRLSAVFADKRTLLITLGLCLLLALPQMIYWYLKTGLPVYDSYKNAGIGLDFFRPHIMNVLFSYRKGWLLYTPLMIFALSGFYFLYKQNRSIFRAITVYFLIAFYIISSWTEWWYGAGFSNRPLITTYPLLAICLGYFLEYIGKQRLILKIGLGLVFVALIGLNQFQWWQLKNYILDPYRTTKAYYWATFLKTTVTAEDKDLLMFQRDFSGDVKFTNKEKYIQRELESWTFDKSDDKQVLQDTNGNHFYRLLPEQEYSKAFEYQFNKLTERDHVWLKASLDIRYPAGFEGELPCLVMAMDHLYKSYGYFAPEIKIDSAGTAWQHFSVEYLSPEIRDYDDLFKCYVWKRGKSSFDIDNFKLEVYEPK